MHLFPRNDFIKSFVAHQQVVVVRRVFCDPPSLEGDVAALADLPLQIGRVDADLEFKNTC